MNLRITLWVMVVLGTAALACGGPVAETRLVDVGGHRLFLRCVGEGSSTVVLEAGLGATSQIWSEVEKRVAETARVCSYDRAGLGESEPGAGAYTAARAAVELDALIANAGIQTPVVLVGHSYGGLIARIYASSNPAKVSGLVLVDSLHPDNLKKLRALAGEGAYRFVLGAMAGGNEATDLEASMDEARDVRIRRDLPLTVITAARNDLTPVLDETFRLSLAQAWLEAQRKLAALSANSTHIVVEDSGHCVQCEKPELVADAIIRLVKIVRTGP